MKMFGTFAFFLILSGFSGPRCNATVYHSDGSAASLQALHDAASNGDTITLPAGTFTWVTGVTISKAIKLQGVGSGRIIGNTKTSAMISTGSKTFATTRVIPGIITGQTLRIAKMPNSITPRTARENYMEGTVTSYSGTTLVMNVTSTGGSGTYQFWWIATKPQTTIINNATLSLSESNTGPIEVSGIQFVAQNATSVNATTNAYIVPKSLIHDCWFETGGNSSTAAILANTNQMLIWNCSFDDTFSQIALGIQLKWEDDTGLPSWRSNSTFGAADTSGTTNLYIEDCDFHGYLNATDFDGNSRAVFRHNTLDNSGMGSHGADTGPIGMRHVEIYDNELIFDNFGDCNGAITIGLNWFFWQRGGTSVITDNIIPAITSCAWGSKGNVLFSLLNLTRNSGCYPCWVGYPAPHQIGQGYVNGAIFHSWSCDEIPDANYYISLEPTYIWNNTGAGGNNAGLNAETDQCGNNQHLADYVIVGRDYFSGVPKPGYQKFVYPHPLRNGGPTPTPTATGTASSTSTPTSTPTPTSTLTPTPTRTPRHRTPTPTPTPTSSSTPTPTPTPPATPTPTPPAGLVAAYNFNEGSGTTVNDASGNGIIGNILGAIWTTGGKNGNALSFNGSSSYVDLGNPALLQITGNMTLSAWVKAAANPADDGQIVAKSDDASGWQLKTSPDTGPHTFGVAVSTASGRVQRYSTTVRSLNVWYYVAGVYNAAAQTLDIYVNGVLDNGVLRGIIPASQVNAPVNVYIGKRTSLHGGGYCFNGIIDDVRIYNRVLSQAEIQSDMNRPVGRPAR